MASSVKQDCTSLCNRAILKPNFKDLTALTHLRVCMFLFFYILMIQKWYTCEVKHVLWGPNDVLRTRWWLGNSLGAPRSWDTAFHDFGLQPCTTKFRFMVIWHFVGFWCCLLFDIFMCMAVHVQMRFVSLWQCRGSQRARNVPNSLVRLKVYLWT